jgi:hypothetical protein
LIALIINAHSALGARCLLGDLRLLPAEH